MADAKRNSKRPISASTQSNSSRKVATKGLKATTKSSNVICSICEDVIVDESQDSIMCEGLCSSWLHRGCAGLTKTKFAQLRDSDKPFHCPKCRIEALALETATLKDSLASLSREVTELKTRLDCLTMRDSSQVSTNDTAIANLAIEVEQLKKAVLDANSIGSGRGRSWSEVVKRGKSQTKHANSNSMRGDRNSETPHWIGVSVSTSNKKRDEKPNESSSVQRHRRKSTGEKLTGIRKVWGSMRSCTAQTMASTIARLCPTVAEKLQVRRKYKISQDGKIVRWWFLIRGDEQVLVDLEGKWDSIALQTSWKLENCYKYNALEHQLTSSVVAVQEKPSYVTAQLTTEPLSLHESNCSIAPITSSSSVPSPSVCQP